MDNKNMVPEIRFPGFTDPWEQRKFDEWGDFYYGRSCPKWSVTEDATIPCIRYGELYTKFGAKIDKVYSYTNMPPEKLRFSKGTEVLIPRVGEDPMDYNHCTWLSLKDVAIGEMISVFNTDQDPLFSATMFNATLQKEFAIRVEGGSVTNLYFDKLRNIDISYPSLQEQKEIGAFFENIDNLITLHQRKLNEIKDFKKGMLQKMFPQNGERFPEIRFPGFTDPWEQRKLGEVGKARSGVGFPDAEQGGTSGTPFYKVSDMNNDGNENEMNVANNYVTDAQIAARKWSPIEEVPAIFFAKVGAAVMLNRKRLCRFPFLLDNNTMASSLGKDQWDADFAKALFETVDLTSLVQIGALPSYNASDVEGMEIMLPKISEQSQIGAYFRQLDNLITLHQRKQIIIMEDEK